uniref:MULE transposase domain-containing protein n=1 Tax=Lactuca sativa TaxID=4236 RepID=A0A9R1VF50_LACSA|nr:hypothetical protein LSAT_V11C500295890 [Lactuca sativa]
MIDMAYVIDMVYAQCFGKLGLKDICVLTVLKNENFTLDFWVVTVGMDGNNQILPISFGIGKTKSRESWIWFLLRLKECIGYMPSLAIISDKIQLN